MVWTSGIAECEDWTFIVQARMYGIWQMFGPYHNITARPSHNSADTALYLFFFGSPCLLYLLC